MVLKLAMLPFRMRSPFDFQIADASVYCQPPVSPVHSSDTAPWLSYTIYKTVNKQTKNPYVSSILEEKETHF